MNLDPHNLHDWRKIIEERLTVLEGMLHQVNENTRTIRLYFEGATKVGTFFKNHKTKILYVIMGGLIYTGYINPEQAAHIKTFLGM